MLSRLPSLLGILTVLVLSMGFAALNGGQRLTLRLGFVTIYRIPLSVVVFASVIVGMLIMLAASVRSDLRVRRILRERLAREDEEERARIYIDRAQQDLFDAEQAEQAEPPSGSPSEAGSASTPSAPAEDPAAEEDGTPVPPPALDPPRVAPEPRLEPPADEVDPDRPSREPRAEIPSPDPEEPGSTP